MTPEDKKALNEHLQAIAKILHEDADSQEMQTLAQIERVVRDKIQEHVAPEIGVFLSKSKVVQQKDTAAGSKALSGS
jgi:hypothetical protein